MRQKFIRSFFLIVCLSLSVFFYPAHIANADELVRVTIPVQCLNTGQLTPALGSIVDIGATILFVPINTADQKTVDFRALSKSAKPYTVYFHRLQWAGFSSQPFLTVNGCILFTTLYADQATARELTWVVESQIPLRLVFTESF